MKEKKFRSWNEIRKQFIYFENGDYYYLQNNRKYQCSSNLFDWGNAEQYTGLEDKNGIGIFEGDKIYMSAMSYHIVYEEDHGGFRYKGNYSIDQYDWPLTCDIAFGCEINSPSLP